MTETNTWPGKPGVPLNPEKDDWHWVRTPDGELVPYNWVPAFEVDLGIWPAKWVYDLNEHWPPEHGTYLGPCLTPDQATALQARVAELERRAGKEERMTDCIKSESYIYASLCSEVSRALYEAMIQKRYTKHIAERRAHGGNMSLQEIAKTLAELGAHMEVTVKFIDAPDEMEGKKDLPTMTEEQLRDMMRDPRYWRQREPEWVKRVTDGFRALVGGKKE